MARKTRVIETVRDRKGELFLGAMALGGVGVAAATLKRDDEDDENGTHDEGENETDDEP